jgi:hypothetical protein
MTRTDLAPGREPPLSEAELRQWSRQLAEQEAKLAAAQAEFMSRANTFVDETATDIVRALEVIRQWFPAGIVVAPQDDPRPGSTRRLH